MGLNQIHGGSNLWQTLESENLVRESEKKSNRSNIHGGAAEPTEWKEINYFQSLHKYRISSALPTPTNRNKTDRGERIEHVLRAPMLVIFLPPSGSLAANTFSLAAASGMFSVRHHKFIESLAITSF